MPLDRPLLFRTPTFSITSSPEGRTVAPHLLRPTPSAHAPPHFRSRKPAVSPPLSPPAPAPSLGIKPGPLECPPPPSPPHGLRGLLPTAGSPCTLLPRSGSCRLPLFRELAWLRLRFWFSAEGPLPQDALPAVPEERPSPEPVQVPPHPPTHAALPRGLGVGPGSPTGRAQDPRLFLFIGFDPTTEPSARGPVGSLLILSEHTTDPAKKRRLLTLGFTKQVRKPSQKKAACPWGRGRGGTPAPQWRGRGSG